MANRYKHLLSDAIKKQVEAADKALKKDTQRKRKIAKEVIRPYLKSVVQEQITNDVVNKPFKDKSGEFRYYWKIIGTGYSTRIVRKMLGGGNTQATSYNKMADDKYTIGQISKNGSKIKIWNEFPIGKSIYDSNINSNEKTLYTQWLVDGDIVMPTLKTMPADEWKVYCQDPANRYKARPYMDYVATSLNVNGRRRKEFKKIAQEAITKELIDIFNNVK